MPRFARTSGGIGTSCECCNGVLDERCEDWEVSSWSCIKDDRSMPKRGAMHYCLQAHVRPPDPYHPVEEPKHRESDRIREREVDNGSFTGQCTSFPSSSWSRELHVWRVRKPHGHPRWSLLNTQGTCRRQSSCEPPHPAYIVSLKFKGASAAEFVLFV